MNVYVDITEFLNRPFRTGIQRVVGELCRHWTGPDLIPVKVTPRGLVRFTPEMITVISEYFSASDITVQSRLQAIEQSAQSENGTSVDITDDRCSVLLCPELFFDVSRIHFYRGLTPSAKQQCAFIVYDLLTLTHPQYFYPLPYEPICRYFCLLRTMPNRAFISRATQETFHGRFLRSKTIEGRVIRLGSDGLGPRPLSRLRSIPRPSFVMVGTIEPRKNHMLVLDAFEQLFECNPDVELIFIGRLDWSQSIGSRLQDAQRKYPRLRVVGDANDDVVRQHVRNARATIFVSAAEGFGLPPVESLWFGTPVIASPGLPSLEQVGQAGIHIVNELTPEGIREGVMRFLDDRYWELKSQEAINLALPDWKAFASDIAEWMGDISAAAESRR